MLRGSTRLRYGPARSQFGVLHTGSAEGPVESVVVLVHGGFWKWPINRWVMALLVRDATARGHTVFNVEYRRLGRFGGGGGWPETFDDVVAAVETVARRFPDATVTVVGHSAGGHLALAGAQRLRLVVGGVVAMAAPTDLRLLAERGSEPVRELVARAPQDRRWESTSPVHILPTGVATVCVHGDADTTVRPSMSIRYVEEATRRGDDSRLVLATGERHRSALTPSSRIWGAAMAAVDGWLTSVETSSRPLCGAPKERS